MRGRQTEKALAESHLPFLIGFAHLLRAPAARGVSVLFSYVTGLSPEVSLLPSLYLDMRFIWDGVGVPFQVPSSFLFLAFSTELLRNAHAIVLPWPRWLPEPARKLQGGGQMPSVLLSLTCSHASMDSKQTTTRICLLSI